MRMLALAALLVLHADGWPLWLAIAAYA